MCCFLASTDVGFKVGGNSGISHFVLQIHYGNIHAFEGESFEKCVFWLHRDFEFVIQITNILIVIHIYHKHHHSIVQIT